jgi:hypothetical protein
MTIRGVLFAIFFSALALAALASLDASSVKDERHAQERGAVATLTGDWN